jgi:hypothetical protein
MTTQQFDTAILAEIEGRNTRRINLQFGPKALKVLTVMLGATEENREADINFKDRLIPFLRRWQSITPEQQIEAAKLALAASGEEDLEGIKTKKLVQAVNRAYNAIVRKINWHLETDANPNAIQDIVDVAFEKSKPVDTSAIQDIVPWFSGDTEA